MCLGIPPLKIKILLESSPPKSRILARKLAVPQLTVPRIVCHMLGGTTCLTLLVSYGLIFCLRHCLSNTLTEFAALFAAFEQECVLDK